MTNHALLSNDIICQIISEWEQRSNTYIYMALTHNTLCIEEYQNFQSRTYSENKGLCLHY